MGSNSTEKEKEFKNVYSQIKLLRERGLKFNDYSMYEAKNNLLDKGYFNIINGLESLMLDDYKNPPKTYTGKHFEDFVDIYQFDNTLSNMIIKKIAEFEVKLKATISYFFSKRYCSSLKDNNNYIDIRYYRSTNNIPQNYKKYFEDHKIFSKNKKYIGIFTGTFDGEITLITNRNPNKSKMILNGDFNGRFSSYSFNKIIDGEWVFQKSQNNTFYTQIFNNFFSGGRPSTRKITIPVNSLNIDTNSFSTSEQKVYIKGLNYIDHCKVQYPNMNKYKTLPFWIAIKPLMLQDILTLMYGLDKVTFDNILIRFGLNPKKPAIRDMFLNIVDIIRTLRNNCAHFELIDRFRTPTNLSLHPKLVRDLNLKPVRSHYVIKLYDTLKILSLFTDMTEVKDYLWSYYDFLSKTNRLEIATTLFNRMGNFDIYDWGKLGDDINVEWRLN